MILILGSNGLLGSYVKNFLSKKKIKFITLGRKNCDINGDILNTNFLNKIIKKINPKIIINFAAYADVDKCEKNKILAMQLNSELPTNISNIISSKVFFIHISTDHIYNGKGPHKENGTIKLLNNYAKTKFLGEKNIRHKNSCILRINFFGKSISKKRSSFSDWAFKAIKNKKKMNLFKDVFFSPISMENFSKSLYLILKKKITGTYNLGSNKGFSKEKFILHFAKRLKYKKIKYNSISYDDLKISIKRPKDMRMDCKKIEKKLGIKLNNLIDEINYTAKSY